jgi:hypothetical protein
MEGMRGFRIVSAYPWKPHAVGLIFDAAGVALFGFGLFRAFAP